MLELLGYTAGFVGAVIAVYVIVRVGSLAHYRTKLEHHRRIMRETEGEDHYG